MCDINIVNPRNRMSPSAYASGDILLSGWQYQCHTCCHMIFIYYTSQDFRQVILPWRYSFIFIDWVVVCGLMQTYQDGKSTLSCISRLSHTSFPKTFCSCNCLLYCITVSPLLEDELSERILVELVCEFRVATDWIIGTLIHLHQTFMCPL